MEEKPPLEPNKVEIKTGALEGTLDDLRSVVTFLAILIAIIGSILLAISLKSGGKFLILPIGQFVLQTAVTAYLINLLLKIIAEFLRIQKHKANLPYSGKISTPETSLKFCCPSCKTVVTGSPCYSCGQKLINPN